MKSERRKNILLKWQIAIVLSRPSDRLYAGIRVKWSFILRDADVSRLAGRNSFHNEKRESRFRRRIVLHGPLTAFDCLFQRLAILRRAHANIIKADYKFKPPMSDGTLERPSSVVDTLDSILRTYSPITMCITHRHRVQSCVHTKDSFYDHRRSHFFFHLTGVWKGRWTRRRRRVNGRQTKGKEDRKSKLREILELGTKRFLFRSRIVFVLRFLKKLKHKSSILARKTSPQRILQ